MSTMSYVQVLHVTLVHLINYAECANDEVICLFAY